MHQRNEPWRLVSREHPPRQFRAGLNGFARPVHVEVTSRGRVAEGAKPLIVLKNDCFVVQFGVRVCRPPFSFSVRGRTAAR
jgi:hypothetical protein